MLSLSGPSDVGRSLLFLARNLASTAGPAPPIQLVHSKQNSQDFDFFSSLTRIEILLCRLVNY